MVEYQSTKNTMVANSIKVGDHFHQT